MDLTIITIPADKANHCVFGALAYLTASGLFALADPHAPRILAGLVFCGSLGLAKELGDWIGNRLAERDGQPPVHGVEFADIAWTVVGGCIAAMGALIGGAA